tara:strand:- start:1082 stop:1498 length:417 start_codon:yes stop_codon:yes gene_type:complete
MKKFSIITKSSEESILFAQDLSIKIKKGDVLGLVGNLASGKTTFIKGLLKGLGYKYNVTSPTFTLINNYNANCNVMHVDFYREPNKKRWIDLGFNELIYSSDIVLVEWADLIPDILPNDTIFIKFEHYGQDSRKISLI